MLKPENQYENVFKVVMIRGGGGRPGQLVHESKDHGDAYDAACTALRECEAGKHTGVTEIRMVRTDYWGEAHVSGRLTPNGRASRS